MADERRGILGLVAAGRITPGEAERLIAAWNDGREGIWIALACVAICVIGIHPGNWGWVEHAAHVLAGSAGRALHEATGMLMKGMGGWS